jgi:hypothetical protein
MEDDGVEAELDAADVEVDDNDDNEEVDDDAE